MARTPLRSLAVAPIVMSMVAACASPAPRSGDSDLAHRTYHVLDLVTAPSSGGAWIPLQDLATNLREATDTACWQHAGWSIEPEGEDALVVVASSDMHEKVERALEDLRRFLRAHS